jgi:hypothetical protein
VAQKLVTRFLLGALVGNALYAASGGDDWKGFAIGGGLGLLSGVNIHVSVVIAIHGANAAIQIINTATQAAQAGVRGPNRTPGGGQSPNGTDWAQVEKDVLDMVRNANRTVPSEYKDAYRLIIKELANMFGDMSKHYYLVDPTDHGRTNLTSTRTKRDLKGQKGSVSEGKRLFVGFSTYWMDVLIPAKKWPYSSDLNFGDLVRMVYHEIYVHVPDFAANKYKPLRPDQVAAWEFKAYYNMYKVEGIPEGKAKFGYWLRILNSTDPSDGAISQMTDNDRKIFQEQIKEVVIYVWATLSPYIR